eukprot:PhF_6_TR40907/c0_g1_i1/m.61883
MASPRKAQEPPCQGCRTAADPIVQALTFSVKGALELISSLNAFNPVVLEQSANDIGTLQHDAAALVSSLERLAKRCGHQKPASQKAKNYILVYENRGSIVKTAPFEEKDLQEHVDKYKSVPEENARILLRSDGVAVRLWFLRDGDNNRKRVLEAAAKEGFEFLPYGCFTLQGDSVEASLFADVESAKNALKKDAQGMVISRFGHVYESNFKSDDNKKKVVEFAAQNYYFVEMNFLAITIPPDVAWNFVVCGSDGKEFRHESFADEAAAREYLKGREKHPRRLLMQRPSKVIESTADTEEWKDVLLGFATTVGMFLKPEEAAKKKCAKGEHALVPRSLKSTGVEKKVCSFCKAKIHVLSLNAVHCNECNTECCVACAKKA